MNNLLLVLFYCHGLFCGFLIGASWYNREIPNGGMLIDSKGGVIKMRDAGGRIWLQPDAEKRPTLMAFDGVDDWMGSK